MAIYGDPLRIRINLVWITLAGTVLWDVTADTIVSLYDVVSDYILAYQHFK